MLRQTQTSDCLTVTDKKVSVMIKRNRVRKQRRSLNLTAENHETLEIKNMSKPRLDSGRIFFYISVNTDQIDMGFEADSRPENESNMSVFGDF